MDLRREAQRWLADDPDPDTREELEMLLALDDVAGLEDRFGQRLAFGTAGIRGTLGAGPNRMNRVVVRRVTAGLVEHLLAGVPDAAARGVVVGHDARHKSAEFAEDVARVLAGAGVRVHALPSVVPTPLVAFAVRHLGAAAGVQITASHNPPSDNGYKVYWSDGAQIVPPLDAEISAAIDGIASVTDIAMAEPGPPLDAAPLEDAYLDTALRLCLHPESRDVSLVYTPIHGVAAPLLGTLLARAGFGDVEVVAEQAAPDPDFPTVEFPNPEEPGALDLALALARDVDADLVLANDPDGDRIAAAVPTASGWQLLSGDEVGCLLAEYLLREGSGGPERVVATTVVSSQLLRRIAAAHGAGYAETLTGFKWLARVAADARQQGRRLVLAYEQALGVMVGDAVRDKDGMSAALVLAELAAVARAGGSSIPDLLDELATAHGVHLTVNRNVRLDPAGGDALIADVLSRLSANPPTAVAGVAVDAVADYRTGVRRRTDGRREPIDVPASALVALELADGSRLQVRPSGTEPLLKFYVEVVEPVAAGDVAAARARAGARLQSTADAFLAVALPG